MRPIDVIQDYLRLLWAHAKSQITAELGSVADLETAEVILTVPAAWDAKACQIVSSVALTSAERALTICRCETLLSQPGSSNLQRAQIVDGATVCASSRTWRIGAWRMGAFAFCDPI